MWMVLGNFWGINSILWPSDDLEHFTVPLGAWINKFLLYRRWCTCTHWGAPGSEFGILCCISGLAVSQSIRWVKGKLKSRCSAVSSVSCCRMWGTTEEIAETRLTHVAATIWIAFRKLLLSFGVKGNKPKPVDEPSLSLAYRPKKHYVRLVLIFGDINTTFVTSTAWTWVEEGQARHLAKSASTMGVLYTATYWQLSRIDR